MNPSDFREQRQADRARRAAKRIHAAGGVSKMAFPSMDAVCAPMTGGGWKVPEPSKDMLEHMAAYGFAESEAAEEGGVPHEPAPAAIELLAEPAVHNQLGALARLARAMGFDLTPRAPAGDTPPRNEDK